MSSPTSTTPSSVLIIGATGTIGSEIASVLLSPEYKSKVQLFLLVRKSTAETEGPKRDQLEQLVKQGATLSYGDLKDTQADLTTALKGIDVLISTVSGTDFASQMNLVPAAKAAGVKWFVPSEFGFDVEAIGADFHPIFDHKKQVREAVKAAGFDWTFVQTATWTSSISPLLGFDLEHSTVTFPESGNTKFTITIERDIATAVADAIVTGRGRNQILLLGSETFTYEEITRELEKASGRNFTRKVRPLSDLKAAFQKNIWDFAAMLQLLIVTKQNAVHWEAESTYTYKNKIPVTTVQQFYKQYFKKQHEVQHSASAAQ
jgi:uncharacterized protein YbjT (DUF2867 family)